MLFVESAAVARWNELDSSDIAAEQFSHPTARVQSLQCGNINGNVFGKVLGAEKLPDDPIDATKIRDNRYNQPTGQAAYPFHDGSHIPEMFYEARRENHLVLARLKIPRKEILDKDLGLYSLHIQVLPCYGSRYLGIFKPRHVIAEFPVEIGHPAAGSATDLNE